MSSVWEVAVADGSSWLTHSTPPLLIPLWCGMLLCGLALALGFAGPPTGYHYAAGPLRAVRHAPPPSMLPAPAVEEQPSFVQTEMRGAAMALHTKQQAPREGKAEAKRPEQAPVQAWQPGRPDYLQFLVDSQHVYEALDEIVSGEEAFSSFRDSGLERAEPLRKDIAWFEQQGVAAPTVAPQGATYATMLREMVAAGDLEAFVCHFYNFYFAHTAGGRMIGKRMADQLLEGRTLEFYKWDKGDVDKELLPNLRSQIDALANTWTREQKVRGGAISNTTALSPRTLALSPPSRPHRPSP